MGKIIPNKNPMREQPPEERIKNFNEVPYGYSPEEAIAEAHRCLQCKKPLCVDGCPVEIDIPGFIGFIAEKKIKEGIVRLKEKNITIELQQDAKEFLADKGWDPTFGARPLKRSLQKYLEDPLAEEMLRSEHTVNCVVTVSKEQNEDRLAFDIKATSKTDKAKAQESNASG